MTSRSGLIFFTGGRSHPGKSNDKKNHRGKDRKHLNKRLTIASNAKSVKTKNETKLSNNSKNRSNGTKVSIKNDTSGKWLNQYFYRWRVLNLQSRD